MEVEVITDRAQWNQFVEASPHGNVTQTFEWGELSDSLGGEVLRLGALENGALRGAMLIIVGRAPLLRRPYLYVPRGPVVDDPASPALAALCARAEQEAHTRGAFMLKVEPNVEDGDAAWLTALRNLGFRRNRYATHPRRSWVLDIRPDEATLLADMKEKWRYNIRLAGRKGVVVRECVTPEDIDTFYTIYQETATRDGFFIHPKQHYTEILRLFGARDAAVLLLAEFEGTAIAGLIAVRCGAVTTYMFGASSNVQRNRMPNHLLQWTAIRWAKARGCTHYDFRAVAEVLEPSEDLYSLYTYKQGYGGTSVLALETHDRPYNAAVYWAYLRSLHFKRGLDRRRHLRSLRQHASAPGGDAAKSPAPTAEPQATNTSKDTQKADAPA